MKSEYERKWRRCTTTIKDQQLPKKFQRNSPLSVERSLLPKADYIIKG